MTPEELKARTKAFALAVIRLVSALPRTEVARVLGGQLLRAGTAWAPTTAPPVAPGRVPTSEPS